MHFIQDDNIVRDLRLVLNFRALFDSSMNHAFSTVVECHIIFNIFFLDVRLFEGVRVFGRQEYAVSGQDVYLIP